MDKNRNYLDQFYNIEYISLNTPEKYFKVSSTFTYFMLKKQKYHVFVTFFLKKQRKTLQKPSFFDIYIIYGKGFYILTNKK